jgi:hypothetical protein
VKRTITTVAVTLGLAVAVSACSGGKDTPRSQQSTPSSPPPSTFGPPNASTGYAGLVSALPDTCQAVKPFLPAGMSAGRLWNSFIAGPSGDQNFQECKWSNLGNTHAHIFSYSFQRFTSLDEVRKGMDDKRRRTFFDEHQCRYDRAQIKKVTGVGESAFAVPCRVQKEQPNPITYSEDTHVYQIGGLQLDVQTRNVIIQILWIGSDYPAAVARKNPQWLRGGKELSYEQALPQAMQVAKAILKHFP